MQITTSQLLPIDGFTYETSHGHFVLSVVKPPRESSIPTNVQRVEIELTNQDYGLAPVRRLSIHLAHEDLVNDLPGVIRFINDWAFLKPSAKNYYEFECRYGETS
jgi:hypothetical protein